MAACGNGCTGERDLSSAVTAVGRDPVISRSCFQELEVVIGVQMVMSNLAWGNTAAAWTQLREPVESLPCVLYFSRNDAP